MTRSRLERVRSRKAGKQGVVYLLLAVGLVVGMIIWGLPGIARLASLFVNKDGGSENEFELKPTPPVFADIPEATYSARVKISGYAQPGIEVALYMNGAELGRKLTTDSGRFEFDQVTITEGENQIYGYSLTKGELRSEQSKQYLVRLDTVKPNLVIESPKEGEVFRGQTQRIANFTGTVSEEGSKVYIGERMAIVQSEGKFSVAYQLVEGDQEIQMRAIDKAGNESVSVIKLRWEP